MSRLLVHAGLHKTGTSAIQRFLAENRPWLMANRYCYPDSLSFDAHHNLAAVLKSLKSPEEAHRHLAEVLRHYKNCAGAYDVIISSEMFSEGLDPHKLAVMPDFFESVTFVFYVRLQDALTESAYNQQVRQNRETRRIHEFKPYFTDIDRHLEWFQASIPTASVVAYEYDKSCMLGGNLILDFIHRVLDIEDVKGARIAKSVINESISPPACEVLRRMNNMLFHAELRESAVNMLATAFPTSAFGRFTLLSPEYRLRLVGECESSNRKLRQRFLKSGEMIFRQPRNLEYLEDSFVDHLVSKSNISSLISSTLGIAEENVRHTLMPNRH